MVDERSAEYLQNEIKLRTGQVHDFLERVSNGELTHMDSVMAGDENVFNGILEKLGITQTEQFKTNNRIGPWNRPRLEKYTNTTNPNIVIYTNEPADGKPGVSSREILVVTDKWRNNL